MNRKLWILGAGSTISHTNRIFPNINNIFSKALELGLLSDRKGNIDENYRDLNNFLIKVFNYELSSGDELDFEKVFTIIDIEEEKNQVQYGILKEQLLFLLNNLFTRLKDKITYDENSEYEIFVKNLSGEDSILTFNWDILLDDSLGRLDCLNDDENKCESERSKRKTQGIHLYERFHNAVEHPEYRHTYSPNSMAGIYIKLHGSIDWNICINHLCPKFNRPVPTLFPLKNRKCIHCFEKCRTLIIPPTLKKSINQVPFIRNQWNIACEELLKNSHLLIWGYRLPPTDFYSEWLIMKIKNNQNLENITIINPQKSDFERFKDIFSKLGIRISITYFEYYQDYLKAQSF